MQRSAPVEGKGFQVDAPRERGGLDMVETSDGVEKSDIAPKEYSIPAASNSRVAPTLPLAMSLLAQSDIEQMREPDTRFL